MDNDSARPSVDPEAVERSVRAALRVEPSPEFLARVRSRIAEEPAPSGRTLRSIAALATAAAVILVMTIVASRSTRPHAPGVTTTAADRSAGSADPASHVDPQPGPPAQPVPQSVRQHVKPAGPRVTAARTGEEQALREFLDAVDRGAITLAISPVARSADDRATPDLTISPLSISALVVDPIAQ